MPQDWLSSLVCRGQCVNHDSSSKSVFLSDDQLSLMGDQLKCVLINARSLKNKLPELYELLPSQHKHVAPMWGPSGVWSAAHLGIPYGPHIVLSVGVLRDPCGIFITNTPDGSHMHLGCICHFMKLISPPPPYTPSPTFPLGSPFPFVVTFAPSQLLSHCPFFSLPSRKHF